MPAQITASCHKPQLALSWEQLALRPPWCCSLFALPKTRLSPGAGEPGCCTGAAGGIVIQNCYSVFWFGGAGSPFTVEGNGRYIRQTKGFLQQHSNHRTQILSRGAGRNQQQVEPSGRPLGLGSEQSKQELQHQQEGTLQAQSIQGMPALQCLGLGATRHGLVHGLWPKLPGNRWHGITRASSWHRW